MLPSSKDEAGPTWTAGFTDGKVGLHALPGHAAVVDDQVRRRRRRAPRRQRGASTFVGGDGIGVSKDSKHAAQAWNFLSWMMSEDAQVGVLAKDHDVVSRADLANNQYSEKPTRASSPSTRSRARARPRSR